ncbi:Retrovirus-related Pol polyprotein from transposon RE1 [Vitis vinifera]|uniref:Retrovirus-related Pol polyprotein from transposon RE1 n=1 Tax=Vitis vinifera TaxID=29760 RepID=A0A438FHZ9_VITVI|nr:Retrovirus-related Pol polyprotein from transposon RE1 [Vitis vinifera]
MHVETYPVTLAPRDEEPSLSSSEEKSSEFAKGYSRRAAKLAFILRFSASNLLHISGNFRRKSTTLYKKAAKSLCNKRVISQHFAKCFLQLGVIGLKWTSGSAPKVQKKIAAVVLYFLHSVFPLSVVLSLHTLNDFGKGLWSSKAWFFMNLSFQKLCHELYTALPHSWIALALYGLNKHLELEFYKCMHSEFKTSMMGELNFLLGLQIKQLKEGTFINQAKYMRDLLKRFNMEEAKTIKTPMSSSIKLDKDEKGKPIDSTMYRGMIGSLLYLTANRPDIIYLKGTVDIGLWYPKGDNFELTRFSNANFAGCKVERKNTSGTCHFLRHSLVSWHRERRKPLGLWASALLSHLSLIRWRLTERRGRSINFFQLQYFGLEGLFGWMGWLPVVTISKLIFPTMVHAFYSRVTYGLSGPITSTVRGVEIKLSPKSICRIFNIPSVGLWVYEPKVWLIMLSFEPREAIQRMYDLVDAQGMGKPLAHSLTVSSRVLHHIICSILLPQEGHRDEVSYLEAFFIDSIMTGRQIHSETDFETPTIYDTYDEQSLRRMKFEKAPDGSWIRRAERPPAQVGDRDKCILE